MRTPLSILIAATVAGLALAATAAAIISPCFDVALGGSLDGQRLESPGLLRIFGFVEQDDILYTKIAFEDSAGKTLYSGTVTVQSLDIKPGDSVNFALPALTTTDGGTLVIDPILVPASKLPPGAAGHLQALTELFGSLPEIAEGISPCFDVAVAANVSFGLDPSQSTG
jgi:hypothetical protein